DLDNCHVDPKIDAYNTVLSIKEGLLSYFPNITIARMNAYANTNVSKVAIEACHNNGFSVTSVPAGTANAPDTSLIIDLFRLELEQPSIVVLVSGDADYCEVFYWLRQHGYTTVLLYPKDAAASELQSLRWEDTGDMHQGVMGRIRELVWKASTHRERFIVHAFGKKTTVPTQQEDPYMTGITYFFTSNSPKMKPFSIENVMLVNMLSMATGTRLWHQVLISLWPNWEAGASSSFQMEVDEDSAARKIVHRGHH
ncbi:endonuclease, partial [Tanacetum coccineum]